MDVEDIIYKIIENEGGYVNDPIDPGGETKYGISKRSYPNLDIKSLTKQDAYDIYLNDWYEKYKISNINSPEVQYKVMDMMVNLGPSGGMKLLKSLISVNVIGGEALKGLNKYKPDYVVQFIKQQLVEYYTNLSIKKPKMKKYLRGWLARANKEL